MPEERGTSRRILAVLRCITESSKEDGDCTGYTVPLRKICEQSPCDRDIIFSHTLFGVVFKILYGTSMARGLHYVF